MRGALGLARSLDDEVTARNFLDLAEELQQKIRALDYHDEKRKFG
jgi:hypothetical protein